MSLRFPHSMLVLLVLAVACGQRPATQTLRLRTGQKADPDSISLKKGDRIGYIEWKQDQVQDSAILFGGFSPCVEGPQLAVYRGRGVCTLKDAVCTADNASNGHCDFRYRTAGGEAAILIEEGYTPPVRPYPVSAPVHEPGDGIVVHTTKVEFNATTQVTIGTQPAVVARIQSPHDADIIIPRVHDGSEPIVVSTSGIAEQAGSVNVRDAVSRRLTLDVNGERVTLTRSEPYPFAIPPCIPPQPAAGPILYNVMEGGARVGCGVLTHEERPELFFPSGPRRENSRQWKFTILVPFHTGETVDFTPGNTGGLLNLFGFEPGRVLHFNSIQVTY